MDSCKGAALLVLVNLTAVNLAAVGMFGTQGVRLARRWETAKARRSTWIAVVARSVLLILLALATWLER